MELQGFRCGGCHRLYVTPGPSLACPTCGRREGIDAVMLSGKGSIHSFSRVHVPVPELQDRAPYVLALVDLAEGGRVTCQIETADPAALSIDQDVAFAHATGGILYFEP